MLAAGSLQFGQESLSKLQQQKIQGFANKMTKTQLFTIILWLAVVGTYNNKTILIVSNYHSNWCFNSYRTHRSLLIRDDRILRLNNLCSSKKHIVKYLPRSLLHGHHSHPDLKTKEQGLQLSPRHVSEWFLLIIDQLHGFLRFLNRKRLFSFL